MIIRLKDSAKLLGIVIMCACAVLPCALFMNSNKDMTRIEHLITEPEVMVIYNATVDSSNVTAAIAGGALALMTIVMLFFYIKNYIDTHKSELGILKALGYSNFKIAKSFWVFGLSVFTGACIGFGIAFAMMPAFYKQMRSGGVLPDVPLHFNPEMVLFLIIIPTLVFALFAVIYGCFKLNQPALELIRGKNKIKIRKSMKNDTHSERHFLHDLKKSTIKSRPLLVFLIGFASFCYADTVQMSLTIRELASDMMAVMMMGIGFALGLTILFIAITAVIKGNNKTIAMMRVFGYSERECAGAILKGYRPAAAIGFIIGTAYQFGLMYMMINLFFTEEVIGHVDYGFDIPACIITLISFIIIYQIFMKVYTGKINRISLKEVMQED